MTSAAAAQTRPASSWVQSPTWDMFWMFSALWLSALYLACGYGLGSVAMMAGFIAVFQHGVAVTHAWSTTYMVAASPLFRDERRLQVLRYKIVPVAIVVVCFALGFAVSYLQTFSSSGFTWSDLPVYLYVIPFIVGHFWHFGRQDFGVLSLYRQRVKQIRPIDRLADNWYVNLMMFMIQPILYLKWGGQTTFGRSLESLMPGSLGAIGAMAEGVVGLSLVLSVLMLGFELSKHNRSLPRLFYIVVIASHPILLFKRMVFYPLAYMWSHWMIATGLVSRLNIGFETECLGSRKSAILRHVLMVGGIAALVWGVTSGFFKYSIFNSDLHDVEQWITVSWTEHRFVAGLFLGYFLAEQHLHYYCDRQLFRFKDAGIRKLVGSRL